MPSQVILETWHQLEEAMHQLNKMVTDMMNYLMDKGTKETRMKTRANLWLTMKLVVTRCTLKLGTRHGETMNLGVGSSGIRMESGARQVGVVTTGQGMATTGLGPLTAKGVT
jgi:hypothetical protein